MPRAVSVPPRRSGGDGGHGRRGQACVPGGAGPAGRWGRGGLRGPAVAPGATSPSTPRQVHEGARLRAGCGHTSVRPRGVSATLGHTLVYLSVAATADRRRRRPPEAARCRRALDEAPRAREAWARWCRRRSGTLLERQLAGRGPERAAAQVRGGGEVGELVRDRGAGCRCPGARSPRRLVSIGAVGRRLAEAPRLAARARFRAVRGAPGSRVGLARRRSPGRPRR